ncbi:putative ATP/GTP-binding protein [Hydrogenivirga sp. 128-5-R1-1]|nr:putative ATP/GTP-binding protein [Hydrogenivirga sp. 128-5-R1-1]
MVVEEFMKNSTHVDCPTYLLDDLPAEHDAFGSHQLVAKAIAGLIETEKGGKAIALIGPWGSGKSTVVKLLDKELDKNKNITLFIFDAWGHHGDPLRRSFLKQLIRHLKGKAWLKNSKELNWDKEEAKIDKRYRERTTKYFPRLTRAGIITMFSSMFVPIGLVLLSNSLLKDKALIIAKDISFCAGIILSLLPLIALGIIWSVCKVCYHCRKWFFNDENNMNSFALIKGTITEERREEFETPDPTSVEFQEVFTKIMDNALENSDKKLVIVVDNLDRVSTDEAFSLWATMRTFFEFGSTKPKWLEKLWLLVPFAPNTPSRLWGKIEEHHSSMESGKDQGESVHTKNSLAKDFVDKTFQAKFCVPLPLMSHWKTFFREQLQKAFPEHFKHHEEDLYALYRIFESKRVCRHRPPTPREIKHFINQVGSYHRIWQDKIPLPVQALYVLEVSKRIEERGVEAVLLNKNELIKDLEPLFKEEARLQEYLAALHFNVDPDKAMQVLVGDEVRKALRSGNHEELKKLQAKVERSAFLTVLEKEIFEELPEWIQKEPPLLAKAALALQGLEQVEAEEWKQIWKHLIEGAQKAKWSDLNKDVGNGLVIILQNSGEDYRTLAESILKNISVPGTLVKKEETSAETDIELVEDWTAGLLYVIREIQQSEHNDLLEEFQILGDAEFYVEVMRSLTESPSDNQKLAEYFVPSVELHEVVQQLVALCQGGKFIDAYGCAIGLLTLIRQDWNWLPLIQALQRRLNAQNTLEPPELKGCLKALLYLDKSGIQQANDALKGLSNQGHLLHHLYHADNRQDHEALALCLLPILEHVPTGQFSATPGQASTGNNVYQQLLNNPAEEMEVIEELAKQARTFDKGNVLLQSGTGRSRPIIARVLRKVLEQGEITNFLSSEAVMEHYKILGGILGEENLQSLVRQLIEENDFLFELVKQGFLEELADLYVLALENGEGQGGFEEFKEFLIKNLQEIPKEKWKDELVKESQLVKLVVTLTQKGVAVKLSGEFQDALLEHAKLVLEEEAYPEEFVDQWDKVFEALEEDYKKTFLRNLRDELIKHSDKNGKTLLKLYGNQLLQKPEIIEEKSDDVVRHWFKEILERWDMEELSWIKQALSNTKIYTSCPKETQNVFREEIQRAWKEAEDEKVREHLKEIARAIGFELEPLLNSKFGQSQNKDNDDVK